MDRLYPASLIILPPVVVAALFVLAPVFAVIVLDVMLPALDRREVSRRSPKGPSLHSMAMRSLCPAVLFASLAAGVLFSAPDASASAPSASDASSATIAPQANLKVAFIGDSGAGDNFAKVLRLIRSEKADLVMHQGDFDYEGSPSTFEEAINSVLGASFPYFVSVGNHDEGDWKKYAGIFKARYKRVGATPSTEDWSSQMYSLSYKGLSMVFIGANGNGAFPAFITSTFARDPHIWKICSWHETQEAMQVGSKEDQMGWGVYEACRRAGAIVVTGHEHSYHRTKTLTSMTNQTVDPSCSDPANVCISPGRTFVAVSGLGGHSIRNQARCLPTTYPYGCKKEWAKIYTSDQGATYGALFIVFNVDGDPHLARGYFKNIKGEVVDDFTIRRQ